MLVTKSNCDWTTLAPANIQTILDFVSRKPGGFDKSQLFWHILCHFGTLKLERSSPDIWVKGSEGCAQLPHQEANTPHHLEWQGILHMEKWAIGLNKRDGIREKAYGLEQKSSGELCLRTFEFPRENTRTWKQVAIPASLSGAWWDEPKWSRFYYHRRLGLVRPFSSHLGCFWES